MQGIINPSQTVSLTSSADCYDKPGLPLLQISNQSCDAIIALQGAQLLEFTRKDGTNLLWLSPHAIFAEGKAIRGGIPVCLPWFGINHQDPSKPKHGFVRNQDWHLIAIHEPDTETTELVFAYTACEEDLKLFPHAFSAQLTLRLSHLIDIQLQVSNHSDSDAEFSWALHSYHPVETLADAGVSGLAGLNYLDNLQGLKSVNQAGDIRFHGEVDRVYESVPTRQQITGTPNLTITGENCPTAIVWNPGAANAAAMTDVGEEIHQQFICVERGAAFADSWILGSGESRSARLQIAKTTSE
ncbi:D-hexose-6-phosphate mutarotase [Pontibacterium granulatum]|uniref:D-hexose-6-phosphate mutarotase n=1 Tax=Pontibacterium granulatum TaxID=2036029 RepID=UPI002499D3FE|nr:D-hexose-6-phosphate mutarotase [Pontibacterium granulatum]MDI3323076.1 D-hexose-6-phosphate mutarotase [Pontibacterium granulatum]